MTSGRACRRRPAPCSTGTAIRPTFASRPTSSILQAFQRRRRTSPARESLRCLATRSRPITSRRRAPSPSILPPGKYLVEHCRAAGGVQQFRVAARQSRSHDARDVRQHSPAQPDGARRRGSVDHPRSERRQDEHLRRRPALSAGGHAARRDRRQGVRLGQLARLGGEGLGVARRQGDHRPDLRAHSPQQPRLHGSPAACNSRKERRRSPWA